MSRLLNLDFDYDMQGFYGKLRRARENDSYISPLTMQEAVDHLERCREEIKRLSPYEDALDEIEEALMKVLTQLKIKIPTKPYDVETMGVEEARFSLVCIQAISDAKNNSFDVGSGSTG